MPTVLIVEDNQLNQHLLTDVLLSAGYQVLSACNGKTALHHLKNKAFKPSLVITDKNLPDISGILLAQKGQKLLHLKHTDWILITGETLTLKEQKALSRYFKKILLKPIDIPLLLDCLPPTHR